MGRFVGIRSIERLLRSVDNLDGTRLMRDQVEKIRGRLNAGTDLSGKSFAPYKEQRPTNHVRPLAKASRLFSHVNYLTVSHGAEKQFVASISGRAATIAYYQNKRRSFVGFRREERREAVRGIIEDLRRWRVSR